MWEDSINQQGGKWVFSLTSKDDTLRVDSIWEDLLLSMIGEYLDAGDEICGAVLGKRKNGQFKISLWTKTKDAVEEIEKIGRVMRKELGLPPNIHLDYFPHRDGAEFPTAIVRV